ncbi:hypothetical protein, partial [Burkholderia multivorans]|uniref:hypothetical protein n=1 Tax=Burkholderia multivorans TaxID=87883 RepID=UPI000D410971
QKEQPYNEVYQFLTALPYQFTTARDITEHANLREQWFQDALVEQPWTKPPALVPEDWPEQ